MNARPLRRLSALLFAAALVATACAPDPHDVAPPEVETAAAESDATEPAAGGTADESEAGADADASGSKDSADDTASADDQSSDSAKPAASLGEPIDLGEFNDYDPTDPDPTPLPIDSDVLIGRLANGLTYYLRTNDSPGQTLVLRMAVNVGGVQDPEGAEGAAHFLEHMLFNGTERFSKNELDQALRDIGTDFGAHLNAYTSPDETVYMLDVALNDVGAVDLAFTVLSEWATAATLLPADVEAERGIVQDEYRLRDESPFGRVGQFIDDIYYRGTLYEGMAIGGTAESNAAITPEILREFYDRWYRPENMALVLVGDMAVADMEALVVEHFSGFSARTDTAPAQPSRHTFTVQFATEPVAGVATHPDHGFSYVSLDWQLPAWPSGTVGGERLLLAEDLIAQMLDIRLDAAHQAGWLAQATEPHIGTFPAARSLRLIGTNYEGDDLAQATTDYLSVVHGAARYGFTDAEFAQAVSGLQTALQFQLNTEETRQDGEYAAGYVAHFLSGEDVSATAERVARQLALLDTYSPQELTAHLRWVLQAAPPLVVSVGPDPAGIPTADELLEAIAAVEPLPAPPPEPPLEQLMERPEPVAATAEREIALFDGGYEWEFANGARVTFVPSDIAAGEVNVAAQSLGGWSLLEPGQSALVGHAVGAVTSSGLGDASATQLDEYLADLTAGVSPYIGEFTEGFGGGASPDDLEALFAQLHLYATQPRLTEVALAEQRQAMEARLSTAETYPQWISELALIDALYQGSPWHKFVASQAQIDAISADGLLAAYRDRLTEIDELRVVIVGDTDRATVGDLAARYIGTLGGGEPERLVNRRPGFPSGAQRISIPVEADAGASGFDVVFGGEAAYNTQNLVLAEMVSEVVRDLLLAGVREELGDTYSVSASVAIEPAIGEFRARVSSTGPPDELDLGFNKVIEILTELIADGPTQRDFDQARAVVRDHYALESNSQIVDALITQNFVIHSQVGTPAQRRATLAALTAADVHDAIKQFFNLDNRIEVFRTSE